MPKPKPKARRVGAEPEYFPPKPNPMFPDWLTAMLSFVRYPEPVACAHCGRKKKRGLWTLCVPFNVAGEPEQTHLVLRFSPKVYPRLTPVCDDHFLRPAFQDPDGEAETLLAALSDPERDLSIRGPGGYAFPMVGAWGTVPDIKADPAKTTTLARHATLANALDCISAKVPAKGGAKK